MVDTKGRLLHKLGQRDPDSFAWRKFCGFRGNSTAERMHESIRGILAAKLDVLTFDQRHRPFHGQAGEPVLHPGIPGIVQER